MERDGREPEGVEVRPEGKTSEPGGGDPTAPRLFSELGTGITEVEIPAAGPAGDEADAETDEGAGGSVLRGALERDDGQMPASGVVTESEMERDSGLTTDESSRRSAWGGSRPPRAGFEARRLGRRAPVVVELVGCGSVEARVRPVAVVPGEVEGQFLPHGSEAVRDQNQSPGALVLDGADAALDHGDAAVLADGTEALADLATVTPALEVPGGELVAAVGDKVTGLMADAPEEALQKYPNGRGGGLATEDTNPMMRREQWSTETASHQQKGHT